MDIQVTTGGSIATMNMKGRFDFSAHRSFKDAYDPLLNEKAITSLDISLAGVDYMDSSALGMLLLLHERAQAVGKEVVLSRANATVLQILDIANFKKLFTIR
jgi:anti-anti-sigma factor